MKQTKLIILNYSWSHEAVMNISKRPTRKCFFFDAKMFWQIIWDYIKNTSITLSVGNYFDSCINPLKSFPSRFIDNNIDAKGQHFELLTFGSGRKICPGLNGGDFCGVFVCESVVSFSMGVSWTHGGWRCRHGGSSWAYCEQEKWASICTCEVHHLKVNSSSIVPHIEQNLSLSKKIYRVVILKLGRVSMLMYSSFVTARHVVKTIYKRKQSAILTLCYSPFILFVYVFHGGSFRITIFFRRNHEGDHHTGCTFSFH